MAYPAGYKQFIEENFTIVDKNRQDVPFVLNKIQNKYLLEDGTNHRDVILKARQQGFSSIILAIFTVDFLMKPNSRSVIVADESDNAIELLDRVRYFIESYERNRVKVTKKPYKTPMKYDSKYEMLNESNGSRYSIGTAMRQEFGRSKTITNLHLSECAFYPNMQRLLSGALQAVTPNGRVIMETTANGFNEFKDYWTASERKETTFKPLFYKASDFYDERFLTEKKKELRNTFKQEYPETPIEAFISSGETYFDNESLEWYLNNIKNYKKLAYAEYIY